MGAPLRGGNGWRRSSPLLAGAAVALIAAAALFAAHHQPRPAVPRAVAVRTALSSHLVRFALTGVHGTSVRTQALDTHTEEVTFLNGGRVDAGVLVTPAEPTRGGAPAARVVQAIDFRDLRTPYGNWLAYEPALLIPLSILFVLMAGVSPWRRFRNLDLAAALALLGSMVLFQQRYVDISVVLAAIVLAYLGLRCAYRGLGPPSKASPSTPLVTAVTLGWDPALRVRWMRVALVVLALLILMVGVGSPDPVDVVYAAMEGATRLIQGWLPYGHMPPGIVHGDTYPILTYALYAPLAALSSVNSMWDSVYLGLAAAGAAALAVAWAVFRVTAGPRRRAEHERSAGEEEAGLRAALAWLTFPPLLAVISTGTTDVVLAAMLAGAILLWRRPTACAAMLAVAGWFKLAPVVLLPVCLAPLRGRRLAAALAAVLAVSIPLVALLVIVGGMRGPADMLHAVAYQFSRGSDQSIWGALGVQALQPLGQACVLGLLAAIVVKLRREPELGLDRPRIAALTTAVLIGMQLAADYWAFLYLVWIVPGLCASLLSDSQVAAAETESVVHGFSALEAVAATAG
jgi:Glycosyltransferase family 87